MAHARTAARSSSRAVGRPHLPCPRAVSGRARDSTRGAPVGGRSGGANALVTLEVCPPPSFCRLFPGGPVGVDERWGRVQSHFRGLRRHSSSTGRAASVGCSRHSRGRGSRGSQGALRAGRGRRSAAGGRAPPRHRCCRGWTAAASGPALPRAPRRHPRAAGRHTGLCAAQPVRGARDGGGGGHDGGCARGGIIGGWNRGSGRSARHLGFTGRPGGARPRAPAGPLDRRRGGSRRPRTGEPPDVDRRHGVGCAPRVRFGPGGLTNLRALSTVPLRHPCNDRQVHRGHPSGGEGFGP